MKQFICVFLAFSGTATIMHAQQLSSKTPEEQIIDLERSFAAAIKTRDTMQTKVFQASTYFLAFTMEGSPIQVMPRQAWLNLLKDYVTESYSIDDIKVHVYGNTAIAMMMFTQKALVRGQDRSGQFVITDTWYKQDKDWLIVERHSSRPGPPANLPTK